MNRANYFISIYNLEYETGKGTMYVRNYNLDSSKLLDSLKN